MYQRIMRRNQILIDFYDQLELHEIFPNHKCYIGEVSIILLRGKLKTIERDLRSNIQRNDYEFLNNIYKLLKPTDIYEFYR